MENINDLNKNIEYWIKSSEQDMEVAEELFKLGRFPQCLFFCHLTIEKLLKSVVVKIIKDYPPYTHDLRKLAEIANIELTVKREHILDKISTFNIAGRYADAKLKFYQEYNKKELAEKYLKITHELILWLKEKSQKIQ
ncbi:MAG: HEPN domain-containing protein [bacterium]|nr:HEPN domain-containing protein [bacterium]